MRQYVLPLALFLATALGAASASPVDASLFGGFTTLAMGEFSSTLNSYQLGGSRSDFGGGYYAGIDLSYQLNPIFSVGPRVEYVGGSASVGNSAVGTISQDVDIIPIMVGGAANLDLGGLTLKTSLYAGYGLTGTYVNFGTAGTTDARGDSFVGEIMAAGDYKIMPSLAVSLDVGCRYTTQNTMVVYGGTGANPMLGHNLLDLNTGQEIMSDFSGMNLGGAITYSF